MKALALALLLVVPAAHAQMYKCVDPSGKTRYSDKPIADCKSATTITAPPPAPGAASASGKAPPPSAKKMPPTPNFKASATKQDKKGTPAPPPQQAKAADPSEHERKYANTRCRDLREEETWLQGPRSAKVENREARLAQVRQALIGCR
jgi:hypothetical protein